MRYNNQKGFTLIEILLYTVLVAGLLVVATSFAWNIINSRTKAFVIQEVEQNGRFVMEKITQSLHQATDITLPTVGNSGSRLELVMSDVIVNPIIFDLNGTALEMSQAGGLMASLNSSDANISNVTFTNVSTPNSKSKNIKVSITIDHVNPDNQPEWEYSNTFITTVEIRDR